MNGNIREHSPTARSRLINPVCRRAGDDRRNRSLAVDALRLCGHETGLLTNCNIRYRIDGEGSYSPIIDACTHKSK